MGEKECQDVGSQSSRQTHRPPSPIRHLCNTDFLVFWPSQKH